MEGIDGHGGVLGRSVARKEVEGRITETTVIVKTQRIDFGSTGWVDRSSAGDAD
jgi:hypothetical protein